MQAIGGGVDFDSANADVQVISDAPIVSGTNLFGGMRARILPAEDGASRCRTTVSSP
jgi:hypothetical protein